MNKVSKLIHDCNFRINFFTTSKNNYLINEINNQINKLYFETDCQKLSIYTCFTFIEKQIYTTIINITS